MLDDGKARMLFRNSMLFYFSSDIWSSYTSHSYNTHKFQESVYKEAQAVKAWWYLASNKSKLNDIT